MIAKTSFGAKTNTCLNLLTPVRNTKITFNSDFALILAASKDLKCDTKKNKFLPEKFLPISQLGSLNIESSI